MPNIIKILQGVGAIYTPQTHSSENPSHFVLTSGRHSDTYINKADLLMHPKLASTIGRMLANINQRRTKTIDVIVGPAYGGITLAHCTAYHCLPANPVILNIFTESVNGEQKLKRFVDKVAGKKKTS